MLSRVEENTSVWQEFKDLQTQFNCFSLGEGSSEYSPPKFLLDELVKVIYESQTNNQYTRSWGAIELVEALAKFYGKKFGGREINPLTEVVVGPGGINVIINALLAFINPG